MFLFHQLSLSVFHESLILIVRVLFCWVKNSKRIQLDTTTNYDERRKIRSRLREVMADKEGILNCVKFIFS